MTIGSKIIKLTKEWNSSSLTKTIAGFCLLNLTVNNQLFAPTYVPSKIITFPL
jgi:hypothetical protein